MKNENNGVIKIQTFLIIGLLLVLLIFGYFKNREIKQLKNSYLTNIKKYEKIIEDAEKEIQREQRVVDSLEILISAKQQTIINNNYIYEIKNKQIANFDDSTTSILYRENLRTMYSKYGYLLNK